MSQEQSAELVRNSWKYRQWKDKILQSGCRILSERIRCVVQRDSQSYYSSMIDVKLQTPENTELSRCLVLRGPSVVIIPVFECGSELKTIMVQQRRIVNGEFSLEFPSGGVGLDQDPKSSALAEAREELGMNLDSKDLIPLSAKPLVVCDSLLDEVVYWYYFRKKGTPEELVSYAGKRTGEEHLGESITLKVMDFAEVPMALNFQSLVGLQLLRQAGIFR